MWLELAHIIHIWDKGEASPKLGLVAYGGGIGWEAGVSHVFSNDLYTPTPL